MNMVDSLNDSSDDNFVSEISKDLEMDNEYASSKLLELDNTVDDDNLDQHIQSSVHPKGVNSKSYPPALTDDEKAELDVRSIYVGNVDYGSTAKELEAHFKGCGAINRITILTNKYTGHPKGFAYIEFAMPDSVDTAMLLDDSEFRSRQIKVMPKRTNLPGYSTTNRPPRRIRGGRSMIGRFHPVIGGRPRTSRFRRRGSYHYAPY
uniref:Polyadenylate-binding protein 2 n=1 Tax=Schmidtea mediterranea TaxID=79327 RepID=A0A023ZS93_SCHMD|nr:polyadenylate-binding protein 2 [Schmidtea mediterranea]